MEPLLSISLAQLRQIHIQILPPHFHSQRGAVLILQRIVEVVGLVVNGLVVAFNGLNLSVIELQELDNRCDQPGFTVQIPIWVILPDVVGSQFITHPQLVASLVKKRIVLICLQEMPFAIH